MGRRPTGSRCDGFLGADCHDGLAAFQVHADLLVLELELGDIALLENLEEPLQLLQIDVHRRQTTRASARNLALVFPRLERRGFFRLWAQRFASRWSSKPRRASA